MPLRSTTSQHFKSLVPHAAATTRLRDCDSDRAQSTAALHDPRVAVPLPRAQQAAGGDGVRVGTEAGPGSAVRPHAGWSGRCEGRKGRVAGSCPGEGLTQTGSGLADHRELAPDFGLGERWPTD
jgi:hypothetical protein